MKQTQSHRKVREVSARQMRMSPAAVVLLAALTLSSCASTEDYMSPFDYEGPFDYSERRVWLEDNPDYAGRAARLAGASPIRAVADVTLSGSDHDQVVDEVWDLGYAAGENSAACFLGDAAACSNIVRVLREHAVTGGMAYSGDRDKTSEQFKDTKLEVNIAYKPLIGGYYFAKRQGMVEQADAALIDPWLRERITFFNPFTEHFQDNHLSNAANTNVVTGLAIGDRELIVDGARQYEAAMDGMRADGSLPTETERGASAVFYTGLEIAHLVILAEYLAMAGFDVFEPVISKEGIHKAVAYYLDALEDWEGIMQYAREDNGAHHDKYREQVYPYRELIFGGLEVYRQRYPQHPNATRIQTLVLDPRTCSVGMNQRALGDLCASPSSEVRLLDLINSTVGGRDRAMVPMFLMFGKP